MIIIISAPSGGGKSSISKRLAAIDPLLKISISCTTRNARAGEVEGVDYHFVSNKEFELLDLIEQTEIYGNKYGTDRKRLNELLLKNNDVIFDIDVNGAYQLKNLNLTKVISFYLMPPSIEELERRLRNRRQDSEITITQRLEQAKVEMQHSLNYDYSIINDNFDDTVHKILSIINSER